MDQPDVRPPHRKRLSTAMAIAAAAALTLPIAVSHADPVPAPPAPAPAPAPAPPAPVDPNAPPPDPNAPPADPNAPAPPPPPAPEPGRVDNAAGGFSYVVPAGWKVADATQLSYGQALLTKIQPGAPAEPTPAPGTTAQQPPNDTSVLLGRLDLKLFAGAESDNAKAAARLASDMGEFFMPFPGTRVGQETTPLAAGDLTGSASYYEVKFTDTTKPTGQIWAGVIGAPTPAGVPRGQRAPSRWFVVWLGTANHPVDKAAAVTLAQSIRPWSPPPPPAPDPNAPPPPPADPNAPPARPGVGVPVPVTDAPPEMMPQG
ncbi:APA family fibronectin-binding glycoprotein [Mycolicibacterium cosmeticum]|uniref:APA family fibronectin-binding glycoprotein n=1 Tax=Mycolicibacterium cosmeticum TaxID=258533 RepID=UPI003204A80E